MTWGGGTAQGRRSSNQDLVDRLVDVNESRTWLRASLTEITVATFELCVELPYLERAEKVDALTIAYVVNNEEETRTESLQTTSPQSWHDVWKTVRDPSSPADGFGLLLHTEGVGGQDRGRCSARVLILPAAPKYEEGGTRGTSLPVVSRTHQAANTSAARSQSWVLRATSLRIEVTRRVRVKRPDGARRLRPPLSKFSWVRFSTV